MWRTHSRVEAEKSGEPSMVDEAVARPVLAEALLIPACTEAVWSGEDIRIARR